VSTIKLVQEIKDILLSQSSEAIPGRLTRQSLFYTSVIITKQRK